MSVVRDQIYIFKQIREEFLPVEWGTNSLISPPEDAEEFTYNGQSVVIRKFVDTSTKELIFPWNLCALSELAVSTLQYRVLFLITESTAPSSEGVSFGLSGYSVNNSTIGGGFGSKVIVSETGMSYSQGTFITTDWSSDVTVSGLDNGGLSMLKLSRETGDSDDTYGQYVGIFGINIRW